MKEEGLEKSRMGKRRDLKLRRKKRKMRRRLKSGIKKKEENELGKSLVQVAGVEYKEVEKIEEKTTRVEKKGEKSERKNEKRVQTIFAWAAPL